MVRDSTTVKPGRSGNSDCWKDEGEKSNYPVISLFIFFCHPSKFLSSKNVVLILLLTSSFM